MISFGNIPNKSPLDPNVVLFDLWPELGKDFELNQFYRLYAGAEGWLGDGYLTIWTRNEVQEFRKPNLEAYPAKYHFFASDGGGTQFGFAVDDKVVSFVSAPDIGNEDDIRVLGHWELFLSAVETGDYI